VALNPEPEGNGVTVRCIDVLPLVCLVAFQSTGLTAFISIEF
jgi:hypothetical protein